MRMEEFIILVGYNVFMSYFCELDVEFLRVLVKEWLEVVLDEDFDDGMSLEDLLVDGIVLYRVV